MCTAIAESPAASSASTMGSPGAADEANYPFWVRSLPKQNLQGETMDGSVRKAFQNLCFHMLGHEEEPVNESSKPHNH